MLKSKHLRQQGIPDEFFVMNSRIHIVQSDDNIYGVSNAHLRYARCDGLSIHNLQRVVQRLDVGHKKLYGR
jgi:hypothetical protein